MIEHPNAKERLQNRALAEQEKKSKIEADERRLENLIDSVIRDGVVEVTISGHDYERESVYAVGNRYNDAGWDVSFVYETGGAGLRLFLRLS